MAKAAEYQLSRVIPTPQCDGDADNEHALLDMWYEGYVDDAQTTISYLCRACGKRLEISAACVEVPPAAA
jgi:hypothetical protein